jgi:hypothetical protein
MPQKAYAASSLTPTQSAPDTQTKDTAAAVDAKIFDSGGYPGSAVAYMPDGASMDNQMMPDIQRAGGPASASANIMAPAGGSWNTPLLLVVGGAALYFLLKKKPKAGKLGTVRTTRSRTTRRRTR